MPAAVYDDLLQRIVMTGGAIKRGPQALQKHLSALGDMMVVLIDPDMGPQLSSAYRQKLKQAASQFSRSVTEFFCAFSYADISAAKGNTFLGMTVNPKIQSARLVRVHICSDHGIQNYQVSFSTGTQDQGFDTPTGRQTT